MGEGSFPSFSFIDKVKTELADLQDVLDTFLQ